MRRRWLLLSFAALVMGLPDAASAAGPTWLDSQQVSDVPHDGREPAVAMAPDGTVIVAYVKRPHVEPPAPVRGTTDELVVRKRPPGGSFGPEQVVDATGLPLSPKLAVDPTGRAVLAWRNAGTITTAVAPPGGAFGDELSYTGESGADNLNLGVDPDGQANLLWRRPGGDLRIGTRPPSGPLLPAQSLDTTHPPSGGTDNIQQVAFAEGPGGDAYAVWLHEIFDPSGPTSTQTIDAAGKTSGGSYGAPVQVQTVSGSDQLDAAQVGVDQAGNALIAWTRGAGTTSVDARFWPKSGSLGALEHPSAVPGAGSNSGFPVIAFDSLGAAVVGFVSGDGPFALQYTERTPAGSYGPAVNLGTSAAGIGALKFSENSLGQIVAGWGESDTGEVAIKPLGSAFLPSHAVSPAHAHLNDGVSVAVDPQNNAVATWTQADAGIPHVYVAGYDGSGPSIQSLSVPGNAVTGVPINVSVSPLDVWSAVTGTGWTFGDGATAVGPTATHTFKSPGDYPVQPDAVDALGQHAGFVTNVHVVSFLGSFGITNSTFAVGPRRTPVSAVKRGTTFRFTLGTPATVRIKIALRRRGVRVGKRCRAQSRRLTKGKRRKRCTFFQTKGALVRHGLQGNARVPFSGRIGRKALKIGRYRATATATDAAGHKSAGSSVTFRIVSRRHG